MKTHVKSCIGPYRKMALALSLALGSTQLHAGNVAEPNKDGPVAALMRHAAEAGIELPADLSKFEAYYLQEAEKSRAKNRAKNTHQVTNCNNSGPGSLHAAVSAAQSGHIVDLTGLNCDTISLTNSIVTDVNDLTIRNSGGTREISGNNNLRPIRHNGNGKLTLEGLSITKGKVADGNDPRGGCILSKGEVVLDNTEVRDCEVSSNSHAFGGGIYALGNVTVRNGAVVKRNKAVGETGYASGGGVLSAGRLFMENGIIEGNEAKGKMASGGGARASNIWAKYSTVRDNKVIHIGSSGSLYARGGGVSIFDYGVKSSGNKALANLIMGVTISGNSVKTESSSADVYVEGAGISIVAAVKTVIKTSTIANNTAEGNGWVEGAISVYGKGGIEIESATITGNKSRIRSQTDAAGIGAGITLTNYGSRLKMESSIVSGNHVVLDSGQSQASDIGVNDPEDDVYLEIIGRRNFINVHHPDIEWEDTDNDISPTADANLEPLKDNGGFTLTMMPRANSPVLNKGIPFTNWDQRGECFLRTYGPQADIGAVERGSICNGIFHDDFEDEY